MSTQTIKLKAVVQSPATLQYKAPRPSASGRPTYQRRFYPNDEAKDTLAQPWLATTDPMMPPYPYGRNVHFDEANYGLYGGKTIQSGNKVSDGRNKGRTLRKWYPNVRVERLKSKALNIEVSLPIVARVSRTIQKCGGLDEYLLGEKPARIKELGLMGWKLRWMVMKSNVVRKIHEKQRQKLQLPSTFDVDTTFAEAWADPNIRKSIVQKMHAGWQELKEKDARFQKHFTGEEKLVRKLRSLEIYDPKDLIFSEYVEEDEAKTLEIPGGFGLLDRPGARSIDKTRLALTPAQIAAQSNFRNKASNSSQKYYEGGAHSAVDPSSSARKPKEVPQFSEFVDV